MTHCDSSSPFSSSLRCWEKKKKVMGGGLIVTPPGINLNIVSPSSSSLFFSSLPLFLPGFSFFLSLSLPPPSSRREAFKTLPLAESLTNVALKCNEVWNGSCGYNYPPTGPVTGMISLSLAIRMGSQKQSAPGESDGEIWWQAAIPQSSERVEAANKWCIHAGRATDYVYTVLYVFAQHWGFLFKEPPFGFSF